MLKATLRKDKSAASFHSFLHFDSDMSFSPVLFQPWESGAENETSKQTNKPNIQFYPERISNTYWFFALAFPFAPFLPAFSSCPLFLCYQQLYFFMIGSLFLFLFTQQNKHTLISMQTSETQLGRGIWGMKRVFQRVENHRSWSEKSSMKRV